MIYLQPHAGLANRIRVMVSGLNFSHDVEQKIVLIWKKDVFLFCDFIDLFEPDDKFILKKYYWWHKLFYKAQKKDFLNKFFCKFFSFGICLSDKDIEKHVWNNGLGKIDLSTIPSTATNFYFATCHEFYFNNYYLKYLRPIPIIKNKINNVVSVFTSKTIGIHIRRTDNIKSVSESPLESFIQLMQKEAENDNAVNYFVATDDSKVEEILRKKFPGKILSYKKEYSRTTVTGMQDAMVDLYSLAATSKIFGSYHSSFSDIAARIGNVPLIVVKKS